jgi:hypothetical protein
MPSGRYETRREAMTREWYLKQDKKDAEAVGRVSIGMQPPYLG